MGYINIKVDLDEFDDNEIIEYAEEQLNMIALPKKDDYNRFDSSYLVEVIEKLGHKVDSSLQYPSNSIVHKDVYDRLLRNIERVPIDKLEELLDKYNCL